MSLVEQTLTGQRKLISFTSSIAFRSSQTHFVDKIASRLIKKKKRYVKCHQCQAHDVARTQTNYKFQTPWKCRNFCCSKGAVQALEGCFFKATNWPLI